LCIGHSGRHSRRCDRARAGLVESHGTAGCRFHLQPYMERNCSAMRANIVVAALLSIVCCGIARAQTDQSTPARESVPQGPVVKEAIPISVSSAIDRALKYNLAAITSESDVRVARSERLKALSELLPNVRATLTETTQQINIASFGFGGFPG